MDLEFDLRRTVILSQYMTCWGVPEFRYLMTKGKERIELYVFPGEKFYRYATIGLSASNISQELKCDSEILMVVPSAIVNLQSDNIKNYIFDICAYLANTLGKNAHAEMTVPESPLAPEGWPKAILLDTPSGEPEELSCFQVGAQHIKLLWVVPIHGAEYDLIKTKGIEMFDDAMQNLELSLVDVRRSSCV